MRSLVKKAYNRDLTRDSEMMVNKYKMIVYLMTARGALALHHQQQKTLNLRAALSVWRFYNCDKDRFPPLTILSCDTNV